MTGACFLAGAHTDHSAILKQPLVAGSSNPVTQKSAVGGAAFNAATAAARLGLSSTIVSPVGDDQNGRMVSQSLSSYGITDKTFINSDFGTASYTAVLEHSGDLAFAISDMEIYDNTPIDRYFFNTIASNFRIVVLTSNMPAAEIEQYFISQEDNNHSPLVAAMTISNAKAPRLKNVLGKLDILFTNRSEAQAICSGLPTDCDLIDYVEWFQDAGTTSGAVTDGASPLVWWHGDQTGTIKPNPAIKIVSVTGAGDAFAGAALAFISKGETFDQSLRYAMSASALVLQSENSISDDLNLEKLMEHHSKYPPA